MITHLRQLARDRDAWRCETAVSVIVPVLNEGREIGAKLDWLRENLSPSPLEVIVVDGGSNDHTVAVAEQAGGIRVLSSARSRARQMNAGARAAKGEYLCFLHADSRPPPSLVHVIRATLAEPRTVAGGFLTLITRDDRSSNVDSLSRNENSSSGTAQGSSGGGRLGTKPGGGGQEARPPLLWFMTVHQFLKTYYFPLLLRPQMYWSGGLCLFGDQTLFVRAVDFAAVDGFAEDLPIMEDADLMIRLNEAGPVSDPVHATSPTLNRTKATASLTQHTANGSPAESAEAASLAQQNGSNQRPSEGTTDHSKGEANGRLRYRQHSEAAVVPSMHSKSHGTRGTWLGRAVAWVKGFWRRGRTRMVYWPPAYTSGRRLQALGNWRATQIHLLIGGGWYLGVSMKRLTSWYHTLYNHSFR
mmetsp:Transcript_16804/g.50198  ORF Transcript_16804/g.50198 Transcript_16804/m.50198 type:complete len:415 (-) Transcript_16804:508-1752(-)